MAARRGARRHLPRRGIHARPRLPIYAEYVDRPGFLDSRAGALRSTAWRIASPEEDRHVDEPSMRSCCTTTRPLEPSPRRARRPPCAAMLERALDGDELDVDDGRVLSCETEDADLAALIARRRRRPQGRRRRRRHLRRQPQHQLHQRLLRRLPVLRLRAPAQGAPTRTTVTSRRSSRKVQEAVDRGATEICMQGGINPEMPMPSATATS